MRDRRKIEGSRYRSKKRDRERDLRRNSGVRNDWKIGRYPGDTEALEMGNEAMENNKAELEK